MSANRQVIGPVKAKKPPRPGQTPNRRHPSGSPRGGGFFTLMTARTKSNKRRPNYNRNLPFFS